MMDGWRISPPIFTVFRIHFQVPAAHARMRARRIDHPLSSDKELEIHARSRVSDSRWTSKFSDSRSEMIKRKPRRGFVNHLLSETLSNWRFERSIRSVPGCVCEERRPDILFIRQLKQLRIRERALPLSR